MRIIKFVGNVTLFLFLFDLLLNLIFYKTFFVKHSANYTAAMKT